ncbi:hypothetical protein CC1G_14548 [Coprinopsis cinerea okayama7|uniref:Uncharacterized protein n=1 Tax=Coprinopsis cinerea (strain Okayama-7 / 130 / ATCC MYA-4618 / FGSC 9003) TaxID=240176 RepID=D6RMF4_COPC7|nr:hypothetical protein CC1G_14548 [Coprinopsis cinerea okayama7\|eukprot:XP_002911116.1 hypothetical protein CC1G_14548 [Coprinopsis cinerea okayama7\
MGQMLTFWPVDFEEKPAPETASSSPFIVDVLSSKHQASFSQTAAMQYNNQRRALAWCLAIACTANGTTARTGNGDAWVRRQQWISSQRFYATQQPDGIDVDATDHDGWTALMETSHYGHIGVVEQLVQFPGAIWWTIHTIQAYLIALMAAS